MDISTLAPFGLFFLIFIVAVLYSSVGHGGASGYLAVLSFFTVAPKEMATTALVLNLVVAGIAFVAYSRAGHFNWRLTWPFLLTSIPTAFIGGMLHITERTYFLLLAAVLVFAAYRMLFSLKQENDAVSFQSPQIPIALTSGLGIGLLSGAVGVGGGIFLSPLMILFKWADPKVTSATSACFILANSLSGLGGRLLTGNFALGDLVSLILAGLLGGWLGSHYGANKLSSAMLRRILALVLVIASFKLFIKYI